MLNQSLTGAWQFRQAGSDRWLPATVPGGVHTDLLAAGQIPDPFAADNEKRVAWVAESDWEYRRSFEVAHELLAADRLWLVCDGLDTLATVTLNGHLLGQIDNMFRQYRWDVQPYVRAGAANELLIAFASPVQYARAQQARRELPGVSHAIAGGPHLRKAPCQFGWDWGPQLPPIGIWKDLRLEADTTARLAGVHLRQRHEDGRVTVSARAAVERSGRAALAVALRVVAPDGTVAAERTVDLGDAADGTVEALIRQPQLWWPNGYGSQPLYQVEITLLAGDRALDHRTYQMGLRTLELRQEPDQWGRSFVFVVNGVPIFAKGSNWIPADSFPTRSTEAYLEGLIQAAVVTHHNMLRVWGGGFYEDERFYDLCDRYGILIWQDFIYSCSVYPLNDPAFLENVHVETIENVQRLRHRACLALWCGNNEMEEGWCYWGWDRPELADLKAAYDRFFHYTLPAWCASEDPDRSYWPSSPSSGTPFQDPRSQERGDAHYWEVWHGRKPFTAYRDVYPRFMSEFGFQALPPLDTIRTYAAKADWNLTSYIMELHQKNASGNGLMIAQMAENYRLPKDFPSLVYMTLVQQAEGIRYGVEHWRRHMDRVAGTLYWQLNDCWPVASWSSLDYYGRWKALHYAARRFYAPLMLSIEDRPPWDALYLSSDLAEPWQGTIRWSLETCGGESLAAGEQAAQVAPRAATHVTTLDFSDRVSYDNCRELVLVAELWQGDERLALQTAHFVPTKHLSLVDPSITVTAGVAGGGLSLDVKARSYARLVELSLAGADVVFSDNYFDLPAGRAVRVTCPLPQGWTLEQAEQALQVRSLYDAYAGAR